MSASTNSSVIAINHHVKHDAKSELESEFDRQCTRYGLHPFERELRFAKLDFKRQWRFDFAWPDFRLAVELHGLIVIRGSAGEGIVRGGHGTVSGIIRDMDKANAAILLGWSVLTFSQSHVINSTAAIDMTQRALTVKGWRRGK